MANKRISDLSTATTLDVNDLLVLVNESQTRKTTISSILSLIAAQEQFAELDEDGKVLLSQIPDSLIGAVNYQGTWNGVATLDPAAAANKGWYYVLSADSSTTVGGISEWKIGDWIISNGAAWQKIDNSDAMISFNSRTGAVVPVTGDYTADMVPEATPTPTNKYYTAARVLGEVLTGIVTTTSSLPITATDSILLALGKLQGQMNTKETTVFRNAPNGYAGLDAFSKLSLSQLPTTAGITEGSNLYYTGARVRAEVLTGLSFTTTALTATDTVLSAFGKVQQVAQKGVANGYASLDGSAKITAAQLPTTAGITEGSNLYYTGTRVRNEVLTGLTSTTTALTATDTVLSAFGKVQQVAQKGVANGYASLDGSAKITAAQLPTTAGITEGSNLYYTGDRVRAEVLTGLSTATTTAIAATDSVLTAFGKVQQVAQKGVANGYASLDGSAKITAAQLPTTAGITEGSNLYYTGTRVRNEVLTGLTTATTAITASDTVLTAFGKVQPVNQKGAVGGYAGLDTNARLPKANLTRGTASLALNFSIPPSSLSIGGGTPQLLYALKFDAGTFAVGDQLNMDMWISAANTADVKKIAVQFNTTNAIGGIQIAAYNVATNAASVKFTREIAFTGTNAIRTGFDGTTSSKDGESATVPDTGISGLPTITSAFWIVISVAKTTATDAFKIDRLALTAIYA